MAAMIVLRGESLEGGGGAERRFARLFEHLCKTHHDVYLVTNKRLHESMIDANLVSGGNTRIRYPSEELSLFGFNVWLMKVVKEERPAVIHLALLQRSLIPFYLWLVLHREVSVVHTVAKSCFAAGGKPTFQERIVAQLLFHRANLIDTLYPSFPMTKAGRKHSRKVRATPCSFTDPELFRPAPRKERRIVFAGRLITEKNPRLLLDALRILQENNPAVLDHWKVSILGTGPLAVDLKNLISQYQLSDVVTMGFTHATYETLNNSMIFLSLQHCENYPSQSLLEAMSAGNAIIATDVGETWRLVTEDVGIRIDESAPALALALARLLGDEGRTAKMGEKAREKVLANCSVQVFSQYVLGVWREAVLLNGHAQSEN